MARSTVRPDLSATRTVRFIDLQPVRVIAVDGSGLPGPEGEWAAALGALFSTAYTLKFALKKARGLQVSAGPLEGLWPLPPDTDIAAAPPDAPVIPDLATWRVLMVLPEEATDEEIAAARIAAALRRPGPGFDRLIVEEFAEGRAAQILHVGPYDAEPPTIAALHAAIIAAGCRPRGAHHEIYLGDPGRTAPERLKTIIRQPVE